MNVQVIERNGRPEWAVLPYEDYLRLFEQAEMLRDIQDYDRIKAAVESGEEEVLPAELVYALADGDNPLRAWREYRRLTQQQLAEAAGISVPFLSQLETGKRKASMGVMAKLARTLRVAVDDLLEGD